ncbi:MAG: hypothetical protein LBU92_06665 [Prevotellaceae bacterium]|nr:hypothetical protein [Prevotellaceae bacterium]
MILVVDSGATKADWRLALPDGTHKNYASRGINPLHISPAEILQTLHERVPAELHNVPVQQLFFYGAGCGASAASDVLKNAFAEIFSSATIEILPDFLGAARALFGRKKGTVAILGTGSACGFYDGERIVKTSASLGYILGDDGSATDLGRRLLRAFFHGSLPASLSQKINVTRSEVLQNVYHSDSPAIYLSSFLPFFIENSSDNFVKKMLQDAFSDFFTHHVKNIHAAESSLGIVGSVGFLFADVLREVALLYGVENLVFLQYPVAQLAEFHILQQ